MSFDGKIFCIGFHKTGTTSIGAALAELGYNVIGAQGANRPDIAERALDMAVEMVPAYDAFQDNPWAVLYRELDERFPGSKFILTRRPTDSWISSVTKHFGGWSTPMREWIYGEGDPIGHEHVYALRYDRHNAAVEDYFKNRASDLLVLDMPEDFRWEPVCAFLECSIPDTPFPTENTADERDRRRRAARSIRARGLRLIRRVVRRR